MESDFSSGGPFRLAPDLSLMSELTRLADRLARVFDAYQLKLQVKFSRFRSKRSLRGRLHMLKYTSPMSPCVVGAGAVQPLNRTANCFCGWRRAIWHLAHSARAGLAGCPMTFPLSASPGRFPLPQAGDKGGALV
jgi:hypothetical protein